VLGQYRTFQTARPRLFWSNNWKFGTTTLKVPIRRRVRFQPAVPKVFWARPKSEFGEHRVTQATSSVSKNYECMDDFWQQVAEFIVFNVSTLLFWSTYATNRHRQAVVTRQVYNSGWDRLGATPFWPIATLVWVANHTLGTTVLTIRHSGATWRQPPLFQPSSPGLSSSLDE